ncbi:MAG: hypothetical protein H6832_14960 [Planctomycetes bacterium]|nr:hypothetical protein [Planctomycetota bacterium]
MRAPPTVKVVADRPSTPHNVWRCFYPIDFGDPLKSYRLKGTSPTGEELVGCLGPVEAPNLPRIGIPFRPLLLRGLTCGIETIRLELEIDPDEAGPMPATDPRIAGSGFYFGDALWHATKFSEVRKSPLERIVRFEGILPFATGNKAAPAYGFCDFYLTEGTPLVRWVLRVQGTMGGANNPVEAARTLHTPASFEMPMIALRVPKGVGVCAVNCIERGGGEVLDLDEDGDSDVVVLQGPQLIGPATPMIFEGFFEVGADREAAKHQKVGAHYLAPAREVMAAAMPPFGSVGPQVGRAYRFSDPVTDEQLARLKFVARGGHLNVFSRPANPLCVDTYPGRSGGQGDFGIHSASVIYGGPIEQPQNLHALLWSVKWDAGRNSHWRYPDGTCVNHELHPHGVFRTQEPHPRESISPDRFGLKEGDVLYRAGGMIPRDLQHHSINALTTSYLLTGEPWLRDLIEDEVAAYLCERLAEERLDENGYPEAGPELDAIRSFRSEHSMGMAYACTGDKRIPLRFAQRVHVYDKLDYALRSAKKAKLIDDFTPMITAAAERKPATVMIEPPDDRALPGKYFSPDWQYTLAAQGMVLMPDIIRSDADAMAAVPIELLEGFERGVAACLTRFVSKALIVGDVHRVVKAIEWPYNSNSIAPATRFMDNVAVSDQPNKGPYTYCECNWAADWCTTVLELVAKGRFGEVKFANYDPHAVYLAEKALKDSMRKLDAVKPRQDHERMRWII